jgi:hypothetical protein
VFLSRLPMQLPLEAPLPKQSNAALMQEAIDQRPAVYQVPVDARSSAVATHAPGEIVVLRAVDTNHLVHASAASADVRPLPSAGPSGQRDDRVLTAVERAIWRGVTRMTGEPHGGAATAGGPWRLATADEVPALVDLIVVAYRGRPSDTKWTSEASRLRSTRSRDLMGRCTSSTRPTRSIGSSRPHATDPGRLRGVRGYALR